MTILKIESNWYNHGTNFNWQRTVHKYDDILFEYPLDSFALTMSYLTGLYTAQKDLMRNIPARVVAEYSKSDRFYG